jgi:uncharacterized protein (TIGR02118 family)
MPVSMMAIYKRPEGGEEAMETFRRRYADEHLPLIREVPGLRTIRVERVAHAYSETDIVMIAELLFDNRAALDAGMASEQMRIAGRNLREIAPGLTTVVVLEPEATTATTGGSTALEGLLDKDEAPEPPLSDSSLGGVAGGPRDER